MLRQIVSDFYFKNACGVDLAAPCDDPCMVVLGSSLHLCSEVIADDRSDVSGGKASGALHNLVITQLCCLSQKHQCGFLN